MQGETILIVEDESIIAEDIRILLSDLGYSVFKESTGETAISTAESKQPDLVLMDINLKGKTDGIQAAEIIQQKLDIPVIFISGYPESVSTDYDKIRNASAYIPKPFDAVQIGAMVSLTLNTKRMMKSVKEAAEWAEEWKHKSTD